MLKAWNSFTRFLDGGRRICLTNNCAERALRSVALGRKAWLFAGSDRGGERAAFMYTLIATARLYDIEPQAWLAELLPWNWQAPQASIAEAAETAALNGRIRKAFVPGGSSFEFHQIFPHSL
jgi:hypothetical protein